MRGADFLASPSFEAVASQLSIDRQDIRAHRNELRRACIERSTSPGDPVAVPANATRELVDAVKACGRRVVFAPVDDEGATDATSVPAVAAVWHQTVAGTVPPRARNASATAAAGPPPQRGVALIDAYDTILTGACPAQIAGIGLATDDRDTAAMIAAQQLRCESVRTGLALAAGLPLVRSDPQSPAPASASAEPVPTGVVVRLPAGCDPVTFVAYAQAELTGVAWLPSRRPLHPRARHALDPDQLRRSLDHLTRLLVVPVGPAMTDEEVAHAVLGIVKAAEYTGWRWYCDPDQARAYASSLVDRYGPDHDAYRPAFTP